jgi:hypothetical protein
VKSIIDLIINLIPIFIMVFIGSMFQITTNRKAKRKIAQFIAEVQGELIFSTWTLFGEPRWAYWGKMFRSNYIFSFKVKDKLHNGYLISWLGKHKEEWMIDGEWVAEPVKFIKRNK